MGFASTLGFAADGNNTVASAGLTSGSLKGEVDDLLVLSNHTRAEHWRSLLKGVFADHG